MDKRMHSYPRHVYNPTYKLRTLELTARSTKKTDTKKAQIIK